MFATGVSANHTCIGEGGTSSIGVVEELADAPSTCGADGVDKGCATCGSNDGIGSLQTAIVLQRSDEGEN